MRVGTPLGEYPFEFRRIERRDDGVAVVGIVAGLKSDLILNRREALAAGATVTAALAAAAALGYLRRASR
jgi:hypothetical protein